MSSGSVPPAGTRAHDPLVPARKEGSMTSNGNSEQVFTITELVARWRVSRHTLTAAIKAGRLQAFRVGERVYRIREAEVIRYEQQHMQGAAP